MILTVVTWGAALASIEDFETWDLGAEELDDEYGLDLYFSSFTAAWESQWAAEDEGVRTSLGCVTRERWEMLTQVHLQRDLNAWSRFRYAFIQEQRLSLDNMQHAFGFELSAAGTWIGAFARPHVEKERHDFGLTVQRAWATAGYEVNLALSLEDRLNNFWTERSFLEDRTRIAFVNPAREWTLGAGRHWTDRRWLRITGVQLPEFERRVEPAPSSQTPPFVRFLGGNHWQLQGNADIGPLDLDMRVARKQSRLADLLEEGQGASDVRRLAWFLKGRAHHPLHGRWRTHWGFQLRRNREEELGDGPYRLRVREILGTVGVSRTLTRWLDIELGYAQMGVDVDQEAAPGDGRFTYGDRSEGRLYMAGGLQFSGVSVRLVETLEVDGESYDVVGVHDKGFIQIQAVF